MKGIDKEILKLAAPAIVNNITVPLLGLSDTAIAGHLGSAAYLGAMAVGAMMLNVIYWLCGFLRMGTTGLSAQAYGARNAAMARDILGKSIVIGALIAVAAIALQTPLARLLLKVISADAEITGQASLYFHIVIWAAPAQLAVMSISGWFIGMQNTVVPMIVAIGINVVNILLSVLLVFVWHTGFAGVAVGTLCSNWLGLVAAILFLLNQLRKMRPASESSDSSAGHWNHPAVKESRVGWGRFFSVNGDLFFRSACIMGVTLAMTSIGARLGETTLAANAVMMQFFLFFSYFMDGFAFAGEALVGKAAGARDRRLLTRSVSALVKWGAGMALFFTLAYLAGIRPVVSLLTDSDAVREAVVSMRFWLVALPPVTVAAFIFDGVFIGLARTRPLLVVTLVASAAFFAISFLGGRPGNIPSNTLLWLAFETYLLLRGILLALRYLKLQRKSLIL